MKEIEIWKSHVWHDSNNKEKPILRQVFLMSMWKRNKLEMWNVSKVLGVLK